MKYAPIKKYYTAQLAHLYNLSFEEMYLKLREFVPVLGEKTKGKPWDQKEVQFIFYKLGRPFDKQFIRRRKKK